MFNEKQVKGLRTGIYWCDQCGAPMIFEDEKERDVLICTNPNCSYSTDLDHYGFTDDEYETQYPRKENILGYDEDDKELCGESYEEVYDELDN